MWRQPKAVWAVAFASVVAFMGIGLVDPILKPIADNLNATPSQVSLLFTSYMAVMGVAMLITGVVSSRIGPKRTLLLGLRGDHRRRGPGRDVRHRAGNRWLAGTLGPGQRAVHRHRAGHHRRLRARLGRAGDHPVRGRAGPRHRRRPAGRRRPRVDLVARPVLRGVRADGGRLRRHRVPAARPRPRAERATTLADPFRALRHRGLLGVAITALLYNFGFFTLLAFTPFPLDMSAHQIGLIFFGWGLALAFTSVVVAPRLQRRFGTVPTLLVNLLAMTATLVVMAVGTDNKAVLATCVVVAGLFIGINNTLITETVMKAAPVERGVASAAYSFVRFSGAAMAPWLAGVLGEQVNVHMPFWVGAAAVLLGAGVLALTRSYLVGIDAEETDFDDVERGDRDHRRQRQLGLRRDWER